MKGISRLSTPRRIEAQRLIGLARAMLTDRSEQMAVHYLDHAVAALDDVADGEPADTSLTAPSTAPIEGRG